MGNWLSWGSYARPAPSRPRQSTADDYSAYIVKLTETQSFLQSFIDDPPATGRHARHQLQQRDGLAFGEVLNAEEQDVSKTLQLVTKRTMTDPESEELKLVVALLANIEPMFGTARTKFQLLLAAAAAAGDDDGGDADDDGDGENASGQLQQQHGDLAASTAGDNQQLARNEVQSSRRTRRLLQSEDSVCQQQQANDEEHIELAECRSAIPASDSTQHDAEALQVWISRVESTTSQQQQLSTRWTINRSDEHLVETLLLMKYLNITDIQLQQPLEVRFAGEPGVDRGALTREFFQLAFDTVLAGHCKDVGMFEGERGHLLPDATVEHLVYAFRSVGVMIVHAVRSGCRGLPGLCPAIQHYLIHCDGLAFIEDTVPPVPMSLDDVSDLSLRNVLYKLHMNKTLLEDEDSVLMTWMERANCRLVVSPSAANLIVQTLLIYYIFQMRIKQIDALREGLSRLNLHQFLRQNTTDANVRRVFPSPSDAEATPELFVGRVMTHGTVPFDDRVFGFLKHFLDDLHAGRIPDKKLSDLVQFLSGSPYLPSRIIITFSASNAFPVAHCCFNELELPTMHQTYDAFRDKMVYALQYTVGFTDD